jgi:predicted transcriptional regulator of viral defense system
VWREDSDNPKVLATRGDRGVVEVAARQERVISTQQLAALGLTGSAVHLRVRRGQLHPMHRGVYVVGPPTLTFRGRLWAAVLACGGPPETGASHWPAAAAWDLMSSVRKEIDVTTRGGSRSRAGIRVHRSASAEFVLQDDGLPVTTPSQTIVDLAPLLSPVRLEQLCHRAEHRRLLDATALQRALARRPPGAAALRAALDKLAVTGPQIARNEFEVRFLEIVALHGLPEPEVNARIGPYSPDFLWRDAHVIVEMDGAETHLTRAAFESDRRRDVALQLAGYRVLRFTWRQLTGEPGYVARAVRALVGTR